MEKTLFDRLIDTIAKNPGKSILLFLVILIVIFFGIPITLTQFSLWVQFDDSTGVIGDTIGGITGPLIALVAAILTFFAFWIQYKANQQQRIDLQKERFEAKFFEMLRLHKENVNEMVIEGYDIVKNLAKVGEFSGYQLSQPTGEIVPKVTSGRKVFVAASTELAALYEICNLELDFEDIPNREDYLIKLAYRLFFNGIESDAVKSIDAKVPDDQEYVLKCKAQLMNARKLHEDSGGRYKSFRFPNSNIFVEMNFKYKPFSGHSSRLSHYYRHLFFMVKYVCKQEEYLKEDEKKEYLKMLRAQLSKHEQLMLYFNFLGGYGQAWENDKYQYFSTYKMIHNLPIELTEFTISPYDVFKEQIIRMRKNGEEMFEYDEV